MKAIQTFTQATVSLSRARPISCESVRLRTNVPLHRHEFTEIAILQHGAALHRTPNDTRMVGAGTALVCPRGTCHGFAKINHLQVVNIYFIDEWLAGVAPRLLEEKSFGQLFMPTYMPGLSSRDPIVVSLSKRSLLNINAECRDLELELAEASPDLFCLRLSLLKVLAVICKEYRTQRQSPQTLAARHEIGEAFELIDSTIAQGEATDIAGLSRKIGLSADHFTRIFRETVGMRPCEYATRRRADLAAAALLNTNKSITEIALELGYHDTAHFSHSFRQVKKVSPKAFRRNFAEAKPGMFL
jgi:AraC-like DNA-binding protein